MKLYKYIYLYIVLILIAISIPYPVLAVNSIRREQVQGEIPAKFELRIFGYTSPNSTVQAQAFRTYAQVTSDNLGYFEVNKLAVADEASEICLVTIDSSRRTGFPLCIDVTTISPGQDLGPLLLSPTISFNQAKIWQDQTAGASGQTLPDTTVLVSFFETQTLMTSWDMLYNKLSEIISPKVQAAGIPPLLATSDSKGFFSLSLPTWKVVGYRMFVKALYKESPTLHSNTLSYNVTPYSQYWFNYILPKMIMFIAVLLITLTLSYMEWNSRTITHALVYFNEKKLKPFEVRLHLKLQRLGYNLQESGRSHRK